MDPPNRLQRALARVERLPRPLRTRGRTLAIGAAVPFVGTAGIVVEELTPERGVFRLANHRRVRNHLGGVHAAATALLAETASGLTLGMHVPDDRVPVIKTMRVDYVKRGQGAMRAVARVTPEQVEQVRREVKGEVTVEVVVTDESGRSPVLCEMVWAWVPKRRDPPPAG